MLRLEVRKYLFDIQQAANLVREFVAGITLESYSSNPLVRSAVERQLEVVGEAVRQLIRLAPEFETAITESKRIIGLRNRLIHGYAEIADDIVWAIARDDVPRLLSEVESIFATGK